MTLDGLVVAARAGDQRAWSKLTQSITASVRKLFVQRGHGKHEIEDLTQITLLRVMLRLHSYQPEPAVEGRSDQSASDLRFTSWLRGIVRNVSREAWRHRRRTQRLQDRLTHIRRSPTPSLGTQLLTKQRRDLLGDETALLDSRSQRAIANAFGGDAGTFAEREGITRGYARVVKSRAIAHLRERVRAHENTPSS